MRALIVDDSSFIREYLRHLLSRMDIACEEAVDGSDALTVLASDEGFDLMLLDVNMPVMNGLELRQHMHDDKSIKNRNAPFIFLSTTEDRDVVRRAFALSVQGFFKKPAEFRELQLLLEFQRRLEEIVRDQLARLRAEGGETGKSGGDRGVRSE